jgi:hypothetical protein
MLILLVYFGMNKEVFREILDKLEGLNYFFISGLSVAIRTDGKRIPGDIDIVVHSKDIDIFANRLGTISKNRRIDKGTFVVSDYGFEVDYKGQVVECTTGYPPKRIQEGTFDKLFVIKTKASYLDREVYVEPLEELVNQKAFMGREKDLNDLELLRGKTLEEKLFMEISKDKGNLDKVLPVVKKYFDNI